MQVKMTHTFIGFTVNHEGRYLLHNLEEGKTYDMLDYWGEQFVKQGLAVQVLEVTA